MTTPDDRRYTVGIAGTTRHTVMCAAALRAHAAFELVWVLTPPPQPIGRKQLVTPNPLHVWAEQEQLPVIHVGEKLTADLAEQLPGQPDFLLVVDFGYYVPKWLLQYPTIASVNVHPSALPSWRGSSPGQFCLLYGEKMSAVTIMVMGSGLDTGPVLSQLPFAVQPEWTQTEYYQHSFQLAAAQLPTTLQQLAAGTLIPKEQPEQSPTPVARRLTRQDGYIEWETVATAIRGNTIPASPAEPALLHQVQTETQHSWPDVISHACRALSPWPGVWTLYPTENGQKRMKILEARAVETADAGQKLELVTIQFEGETAKPWSDSYLTR